MIYTCHTHKYQINKFYECLGLSNEITGVMMWKSNQDRIMESEKKVPLEVFQQSL